MASAQQPQGHQMRSVTPAGLELLALPELALAVIYEQLPVYWRGRLRASCKQLQQVADAQVLQHVVVGHVRGYIPFSGEVGAGIPAVSREQRCHGLQLHVDACSSTTRKRMQAASIELDKFVVLLLPLEWQT